MVEGAWVNGRNLTTGRAARFSKHHEPDTGVNSNEDFKWPNEMAKAKVENHRRRAERSLTKGAPT
jgi:hypothetical protein